MVSMKYLLRLNRGRRPTVHMWDGRDTLCGMLGDEHGSIDNYRIEAEQAKNSRLCFRCQRSRRQQQQIDTPDAYSALMEARKAERAAFDDYMAAVGSNGTAPAPEPVFSIDGDEAVDGIGARA